ncbi:MAG: nucleotidyltransferase domain-containing protein [Pseudodesulfovibrio sp.]|uniref:nucleotidyltransferase domain-containing protein n=1 Tax=Pseudodesulfovibrio sp. TaxID=2035812 RepID=UPI003D0D6637
MIEAQSWTADVLVSLRETFGTRLKYFGLQGSYRRGEATEASDIDLVVLLDEISLDDLDAYRAIVHAMPEGDKACGFICGLEEFAAWPPHELFSFRMDTADLFNRLDDFLPPISREDIRLGAKISAATLLHPLTHSYLYAGDEAKPRILNEACKYAFFLLLVCEYLDSGRYCESKQELLARLDSPRRDILLAGMDFSAWRETHEDRETFGMLLDWCRGILLQI